jgi:hypothetical protein
MRLIRLRETTKKMLKHGNMGLNITLGYQSFIEDWAMF